MTQFAEVLSDRPFVEHKAEGSHVELCLFEPDGTKIADLVFDEEYGWNCQKLIEGLITHLRHHQVVDGASTTRNLAIKHLEAAWACLEDHHRPAAEHRGHLYPLDDVPG